MEPSSPDARSTAQLFRPRDDYAALTKIGEAVLLPSLWQVALTGPEPHALWELRNQHGTRVELITALRQLLERPTYRQSDELATLARLGRQPQLRSVWRYSGALIEHLYLDRRDDPNLLAYAERAARICRVLIAYFRDGTPDATEAQPALWRSYRDALALMVAASERVWRQLEPIADQRERQRKFPDLLSNQYPYLEGWLGDLDAHYREAQRKVAAYIRLRTLELHIHRLSTPDGAYRVDLRLEDSKRLYKGQLAIDESQLTSVIDPHEYGKQLGARLFADTKMRTAYERAWRKSWESGDYVQVLPRIEPPELRAFLWERIYHPWHGGWQPLGTTHGTPFSRLVERNDPDETDDRLHDEKLRALVVIASPSDLPPLQQIGLEERALYRKLFESLHDLHADFLESATARPPTLANLRNALLKNYDLIHVVCHGIMRTGVDFPAGPDDYGLWLEDEAGKTTRVKGSQILSALGDAYSPPKLCFLAACYSAEYSSYAAFVPLGEDLVSKGRAERVVAMNGQVGIINARRFAETFYRQLIAHRHVDLAMNEARSAIHEEWDYGVPILFRS